MAYLDNIPQELRELHQWVVYRKDKHPRNASTLAHASVDDPSSWSSFSDACKAIEAGRALGPGFVLVDQGLYTIIDLDHVIKEDGSIEDWASKIIKKLDSFTEISQSGTGIHIILRAKKSGARCRNKRIEIYDSRRYFALTGNLWKERGTIQDRQDELTWLCEESFGEGSEATPAEVDELILNPDAEPPKDKLAALCKKKGMKALWEYRDSSTESLSEYDWKLALAAYEEGWSDQEIADLIIAFRRSNGDENDLKKALRSDYLKMTIGKVKGESSPQGVLNLLPFKIKRVLQYGTQDSDYKLELEDGTQVAMGPTESFLSPKKAEARLYEAQIKITDKVTRKWRHIVRELLSKVEIIQTITKEESSRYWIDEYINSRISLPVLDSQEKIDEIFGLSISSVAVDPKGRIYIRLYEVTHYVRSHSGPGISPKSVALDLADQGFGRRRISLSSKGKRRSINLWVSPAGFYTASEEK